MNEPIKAPTVVELRKAGYKVDIIHRRAWKIAYEDFGNGKITTKTIVNTLSTMEDGAEDSLLYELLPKGGRTDVTVYDPVSGLDFMASAICSDKDNYSKRVGVNRCLYRIVQLMMVCEYQDKTFKVRVGT